MGQQRRYGKQAVDGYEVPTGQRRQQLEGAVDAIHQHVRQTPYGGIYSGDGTWRAPVDDKLLAPMLEGPDRVRHGERADGADTILAAHPAESREDVQDRLYRSRHFASPRMLTRHRIAEILYAGIGTGHLEPVPAARVDDTVDLMLHAMARGRLHTRMLAAHGHGLRQWLGLPDGEWTDADDEAAKRGHAMCATAAFSWRGAESASGLRHDRRGARSLPTNM
ncbi:hypothetical protein SAMN05421678_101125 [Actinopolymorpha cephalotaxi]|uniref:Uncharacterized protein n=1 Tax=Actinopolymorpha cephalotaxi TaxID=504797 RepID=A0A1I2KAL4_9ACTN|nr:hypothetical protein [Actinopolymorpha cephalotaxi]NYH84356.1 hypothetical protein [Actinopolymorpha cephalotaxi]SFF63359.1 hypothetical protein SAMN05421678_101125 [Actinopolymorpha cephalotaxi]